jgi:cytochrome c-type biogenesis protein CcmE
MHQAAWPQDFQMKKTHIVLLVLIMAAIATLISVFGDFSSYETFLSAAKKPGKSYYIIGTLAKDKEMTYDPKVDANHFIFYAKDKSGNMNKVVFNGEKPRDIEKSEQIVMMGYADGQVFHCSRIQMKCPSKYKKDMVAVGGSS